MHSMSDEVSQYSREHLLPPLVTTSGKSERARRNSVPPATADNHCGARAVDSPTSPAPNRDSLQPHHLEGSAPYSGLGASVPPEAALARLQPRCDLAEAAALFDTLPPVRCETLTGTWRGSEVSHDHPLSGLLTAFGWYGKRFDDPETVHPLLFEAVGGGTFSVNPSWVPISIGHYIPRWKAGKWLMTLARPFVGTRHPKARLRQIEYRGVVSTAMVYDHLPIIDSFRQLNPDTVLGAMDYRCYPQPYFFLLQRSPLK